MFAQVLVNLACRPKLKIIKNTIDDHSAYKKTFDGNGRPSFIENSKGFRMLDGNYIEIVLGLNSSLRNITVNESDPTVAEPVETVIEEWTMSEKEYFQLKKSFLIKFDNKINPHNQNLENCYSLRHGFNNLF